MAAQSPATVITLDRAIEEALASNFDLIAEKWNISVAAARQITAALRPNPVLTVSGQTLNVFGETYSADSPLGPNALTIHTDIPFERGHKRGLRIALAKEDTRLAELGVKEVMRQLILNVANAFVDIQLAKETLKLARENLASLEDLVRINEVRLRSGDLAQVELERSRVAVLQYQASVEQAELQLEQARTQLQQLVGRRQKGANFDVEGDFRRDSIPGSREEIGRLAIVQRPDYLLGKEAQARSRADLVMQLAAGKVDFTIGTEFTRQSAYGVGGNSMGFSLSVPLPVFNRNQGEIVRAQRQIDQSNARLAAMESTIDTEVNKA